VLRLDEVERPVPEDDEVLVKIHATTVTRSDCGVRGAHPFFSRFFTGLRRPKRRIVGTELAGEVEAVGSAVTEFVVGDDVFGLRTGAQAEYVCVRESGTLAHKPAGLAYREAAAICDGACIALACLRNAGSLEGRSILIYGASGSIGTAAVQLAKYFGADVTAVCNTKNLELVSSLGADRVIDYTQEDFTRNGERYDFILDNVANHSLTELRRVLVEDGTLVPNGGGFDHRWMASGGRIVRAAVLFRFGRQRLGNFLVSTNHEDLVVLKDLIEAGKVRPIVERTYALSDAADALDHVAQGHARGKVAITV
jgi:NADPH:quinone reductase-like Zn-dependent oxidoreductase